MQTALVIVIVAAAIFFTARRLYKKVTKPAESDCGCGCDGCGVSGQCRDQKE